VVLCICSENTCFAAWRREKSLSTRVYERDAIPNPIGGRNCSQSKLCSSTLLGNILINVAEQKQDAKHPLVTEHQYQARGSEMEQEAPAQQESVPRGALRPAGARAHWGKGVATAAVKRAVAAAFGELPGVERVEALVDVGNAAGAGEGRVPVGGRAAELLRGQGKAPGHGRLQRHLYRPSR